MKSINVLTPYARGATARRRSDTNSANRLTGFSPGVFRLEMKVSRHTVEKIAKGQPITVAADAAPLSARPWPSSREVWNANSNSPAMAKAARDCARFAERPKGTASRFG